ncbi:MULTISPECIES: flagellar basal body L-ring protein FlgH [unclassified Bradyrhizobium]|uniref:flagellar basal body L-ring protein FlgH n=1 Tax=unclassified Bradyrhizobium TaxID=2631580 RepID=UPI002916CB76|nr:MULTISPECIES: flagellar basal body L-ring protein FlgH [unclassified Bradyrhizobium]
MADVRIGRALLVASAIGLSHLVAGCSALDRLSVVGEKPVLSSLENPTTGAGRQPVQMPMPPSEPAVHSPNSLWRSGSRTFFRDQRAAQVGDVVTVVVRISDRVNISNESKRSRNDKENAGVRSFLGAKAGNDQVLLPGRLISADSTSSSDGKGSVQRRELLLAKVGAIVTQRLPNGNLIVEGKQEIEVNNEIRELLIAGIVRPEDIQSDNTIDSSKLAEGRFGYGGRGQIGDVQQPRYGRQASDMFLPF